MSYNLENLFDTKHDKGKEDWTWLPKSFKDSSSDAQNYCLGITNNYFRRNCLNLDWSDYVLDRKIQNISKVIKQYNSGNGPDIIVLQEIENIRALRLLVSKGLSKLGYKYFSLIEGPDSRGIDIGMISKYPIIRQNYHNIDITSYSSRPTRGILEVVYKIGNKKLTIFGNHWPSQRNKDETRLIASQILNKVALKSNSDIVVATGDFNTNDDDFPNGLKLNIHPIFTDVEFYTRSRVKVLSPGTHFYRGKWSSLDKIFILNSSLSDKRAIILHNDFEIIYKNFMLTSKNWFNQNTRTTEVNKDIPFRFNPLTGRGYSDHLPIVAKFSI